MINQKLLLNSIIPCVKTSETRIKKKKNRKASILYVTQLEKIILKNKRKENGSYKGINW